MNLIKNILICSVLLSLPLLTEAQCKGFLKKECLPKMAPFIHNGQMNTSTISAGQSAKVDVTFYSGQNYRILVCGQESLGKLQFKLLDEEQNVIYDSNDEGLPGNKDFNVATTIKLTVEVLAPKGTGNGCVSVLIGFKDAGTPAARGRF